MNIVVNKDSPIEIHDQISRQIIFAITSGELSNGDALPSVRGLGPEIDVHFNTVNKAYQTLGRESIAKSRAGCGYFVAADGFAMAEAWLQSYFEESLGILCREAIVSKSDLEHLLIGLPDDQILGEDREIY